MQWSFLHLKEITETKVNNIGGETTAENAKKMKNTKKKPRAKCDIVRWPFNVNDLGGNGHPNVTVKMHALLHRFLLREETSLESSP